MKILSLPAYKVLFIAIAILCVIMIFPVKTFAQEEDTFINTLKLGIIEPLKMDKEKYDGLESFIITYFKTYLNKIKGLKVVDNYTANKLLESNFRKTGIDGIYSAFISQVKLYMEFDLLIVSELSTIVNKSDGQKYIKLRVRILDSNAEPISKFKLTSPVGNRNKLVEYMNDSIELIINDIKNAYPQRYDFLQITPELKDLLESNEGGDSSFSIAYFYIAEMSAEELYLDEARMIEVIRKEGFSDEEISKAFMRRYLELEIYHKALSFAISIVKDKTGSEATDLLLTMAEELSNAEMYTVANDMLNAAILYKNLKDPILEMKVILKMTENLINGNRFQTAESYAIALYDTTKKYGYVPYFLDALNYHSLVYAKLGEYKIAFASLTEGRKKVEEVGSRIWVAYFLFYEAKTFLEMSNFDEALRSATYCENLLKAMGENRYLVKNYITKALIYKEKMDFDKANEEIKSAIELAIKIKDYVSIKEINETMRSIFQEGKKRAYSEKKENEYVKLYNKYAKIATNRAFLRSIAQFFIFRKEYDSAIMIAAKTLEMSKEIGSEYYLYEDYVMLGDIYIYKNDYDQSFLQYADALSSTDKMGRPIAQLFCLIKIARIFNLRKDYEKAISSYEAIAKSGELYGVYTLVEESYYQIALIYKELGNQEKYIEYIRKAFEIAKKIGSFMVDVYNDPLKKGNN